MERAKKKRGMRVKIQVDSYTERCGESKDDRQKRMSTERGREDRGAQEK